MTLSNTPNLPPPGWYPNHNGVVQWWDGQMWIPNASEPIAVEPTPNREGKSKGILMLAASIWYIVGFAILFGGIAVLLGVSNPGIIFFSLLGQQLGMFTYPFIVAKKRNLTKEDLGLGFKISDIGWGVLGAFGGLLTVGFLVAYMTFLVGETAGNTEFISNETTNWQYALAGLAVIGAPFSEEMFFRGFLLKGALRRYSPWASISLVTVVFTMIHWQFGAPLAQAVTTVVSLSGISLIFTLLTYKTGRIAAPLIAHVLFNGLGTLALFLG